MKDVIKDFIIIIIMIINGNLTNSYYLITKINFACKMIVKWKIFEMIIYGVFGFLVFIGFVC